MFKLFLIFLSIPFVAFSYRDELNFDGAKISQLFSGPRGEVKLGRLFLSHHGPGYYGGLLVDINLLNINKNLLWHWSLNMDSLIDEKNDIKFRLLQNYYNTKTGLLLKSGDIIWSFGYAHSCSHGADYAERSRILINSGPSISIYNKKNFGDFFFNNSAILDINIIGQNAHLERQKRASFGVEAMFGYLISSNNKAEIDIGYKLFLFNQGDKYFYSLNQSWKNLKIENIFLVKTAYSFLVNNFFTDIFFMYSQNMDDGVYSIGKKTHDISLGLGFYF